MRRIKWIPALLAALLLCLCACAPSSNIDTPPDGAEDAQQNAVSTSPVGEGKPAAADGTEGDAPEAPDPADGEQAPPAGGGQDISEQPQQPDKGPDTPQQDQKPVDPPEEGQDVQPAAPKVTLSVQCGAILDNIDDLDPDKVELVPDDGVLYAVTELEFTEGESVFDVLSRAMKDAKIHMEHSSTPIYQSAYIEGIGNLYELDCGPLSGWMYRVNGEFPPYGCSRWIVQDGDAIEWLYTCDLGRDIGGGDALAGQKE